MQSIKQIITRLIETMYRSRKVLLTLSCLVVFIVTYVLILPAFTLEKDEAEELGGIDVPGVEQTDDANEASDAEAGKVSSEEPKVAKTEKAVKESNHANRSKTVSPVTLQNEDNKDYSVAVEGDKTVLSEDMSVNVREIDQSTKKLKKEYDSLYNDALEAVQKAQKKEGLDQPSDFAFAKFYDISLMEGNTEVEPGSAVDVKISFSKDLQKELKVTDPDKIHIVHFAVDKDTGEVTPEVLDSESTDITVEHNKVTEAAFTADSFSVFAVVYTKLETTVIDAKGDTWEITVNYGEDAKIPTGAELKVKEIMPEDENYQKDCAIAEKTLRAKTDNGLSEHNAVFDISIIADGRVVEPAEGSSVSVEIKLADSLLSDRESPNEEKTKPLSDTSDDEKALGEEAADEGSDENAGFALYNGKKFYAEREENLDAVDLIHITGKANGEIVELTEEPRVEDGNIILEFDTTSFSDYIVTGSTSDGENYVFSSLPNTIYVGDTINIFNNQQAGINTNGGVVTVYEWDDNYNISGYRGKKARVIYAEKPGWFQVNGQRIEVVNRPSGSHPATVSTVPNSEIGVKMNVFDYDLNTTLDDYFNQFNLVRQPFEQTFKNWGVNNGKTLKFWGSGINRNWYGSDDRTGVAIDWEKNTYTENDPGTGIVKNQLSGGTTGYPVLTGGNEDLAYLFTDSNYNNDVRAYMGVDGLFQKDDHDYYYYDSSKNYAWLNPETKKFEVYGGTYNQWSKGEIASQGGFDNGKPIGFFPFHEWDPDHDRFVNWNKALNHHFGLNMEVKFAFPSGDMAPVDKYGNPIVFEFNGDDDMWVFIDGKLAMDIGGIHQPIDGKIDFTNRTVTVAGHTQTDYNSWDTLFDGKKHTLQVFYMERGGCDSNCKIKFNLSQYTDVELDKVDKKDPTKSLAGAKFQLFKEVQVTEGGQTVTKLEPVYWYKKQSANDRQGVKTPYIAESDENGHVKFEEVPLGNYILKEIVAPPDYKLLTDVRSVPVYLDEENGTTVVKYSISGEDADGNREGMQIPNEKPVIDISVEKKWLDVDGQPMDASNYSATFTLRRTKSWTEIVKEGEEQKASTLQIKYYDAYGNTGTDSDRRYDFAAGSKAIISYDYDNDHNDTNNNNRRYKIGQNGSEHNLNDSGSFEVTMPSEGQTIDVYLFDGYRYNSYWTSRGKNNAFSSLSATGQDPQSSVIETEIPHTDVEDTSFSKTLTLSGGATSGKFDSGLYAGTPDAGKFPYQEAVEQADGSVITYTYKYYITEEPVAGFSSTPSKAGPTGDADFTGKFENRKLLAVKIKKVWEHGNNKGERPSSLSVTLSNGQTVTLNEGNHWEATITDLPKYDSEGNEIEYSWTEDTLPAGYHLSDIDVSSSSDASLVTTTLTNSYSDKYDPKTSVVGTKTWDDNGRKRPQTITVNLKADGEVIDSKTVSSADISSSVWPFEFTNLPVFKSDGTIIQYTIEEVMPEGYTQTITNTPAEYTATQSPIKVVEPATTANQFISKGTDLGFIVVGQGNRFVVWTPRKASQQEQDRIVDAVVDRNSQEFSSIKKFSYTYVYGVPLTVNVGNKPAASVFMQDDDVYLKFLNTSAYSEFAYGFVDYSYTPATGAITNTQTITDYDFSKEWIDQYGAPMDWDQDVQFTIKRRTESGGTDSGFALVYNVGKETVESAGSETVYFTAEGATGETPKLALTVTEDDVVHYGFHLDNLPYKDGDNNTYTYYVEETNAQLDGYAGPSISGSKITNRELPKVIDINLKKLDSNNEGLAGATFTLQVKEGETYLAIKSVKEADGQTSKYSDVGGVDDNSQLVSGKDGNLITNLPDGEYKLVEEAAPDGFVILEKEVLFKIEHQKLVGNNIDGKVSFDDENVLITVVNEPGAELPHTGGIGTTIFYILGSLLVIGSAVVLISRRRIRK